jgi:hypothetical protein
MYLFCNSRVHVITLYSDHVCVYYASMLWCWHLIWILVRTDHPCLGVGCHNMHVQPQWVNKHLLPLLIDNKRGEPKMTPRLASLVKWVSELHDSGLQAHHCAEEFTLRWIHPLSHREKLACECPWLAHPSCEPAAGRIFNFAFSCWWYVILIW